MHIGYISASNGVDIASFFGGNINSVMEFFGT